MHAFRSFRALRLDTEPTDTGVDNDNEVDVSPELIQDEESSFYLYEMSGFPGTHDELRITGVFGILTLTKDNQHEQVVEEAISDESELIHSHIHPHEQIRSDINTHTTISSSLATKGAGPIWAIADIDVIDTINPMRIGPVARTVDADKFSHRLYVLPQSAAKELVQDAVGNAELVLADGHHRVRAALDTLATAPPETSIDLLCFVCQAKDISKVIKPIHRIFSVVSTKSIFSAIRDKFETTAQRNRDEQNQIELVCADDRLFVNPIKLISQTLTAVEDTILQYLPEKVEYSASNQDAIEALQNSNIISMICPPIPASEILYSALKHQPLKPKSTLFYPKPIEWMILAEVQS